MKIYLGGAHIDENGNAHGGSAGDQTGRELCIKPYYVHKLGWRVFRAPSTIGRERIAQAMIAACENPMIGYDQYQRDSLYNAAALHGYNPALVDKPVETDCSALVRVCCAFAGYRLANFRTWDEPRMLLASGFKEIALSKESLRVGDILCTPKAGHTEVVVKIEGGKEDDLITMEEITTGSKGYQVKVLQTLLRLNGWNLIVDGDCGAKTTAAIREFQRREGLTIDGICGPATWERILRR